jgi:predicted DNA-binding protein
MPQLKIYLDQETKERIQAAAERTKGSESTWGKMAVLKALKEEEDALLRRAFIENIKKPEGGPLTKRISEDDTLILVRHKTKRQKEYSFADFQDTMDYLQSIDIKHGTTAEGCRYIELPPRPVDEKMLLFLKELTELSKKHGIEIGGERFEVGLYIIHEGSSSPRAHLDTKYMGTDMGNDWEYVSY